MNQRREVKQTVAKAIRDGKVLMTYKTKALPVGRKSVTVGPYRVAVGSASYALMVGGHTYRYTTAFDAAEAFIEYVGRNDAWEAAHGRGRERNAR